MIITIITIIVSIAVTVIIIDVIIISQFHFVLLCFCFLFLFWFINFCLFVFIFLTLLAKMKSSVRMSVLLSCFFVIWFPEAVRSKEKAKAMQEITDLHRKYSPGFHLKYSPRVRWKFKLDDEKTPWKVVIS